MIRPVVWLRRMNSPSKWRCSHLYISKIGHHPIIDISCRLICVHFMNKMNKFHTNWRQCQTEKITAIILYLSEKSSLGIMGDQLIEGPLKPLRPSKHYRLSYWRVQRGPLNAFPLCREMSFSRTAKISLSSVAARK